MLLAATAAAPAARRDVQRRPISALLPRVVSSKRIAAHRQNDQPVTSSPTKRSTRGTKGTVSMTVVSSVAAQIIADMISE